MKSLRLINLAKFLTAISVLTVSVTLWLMGFFSSPFANPDFLEQQRFIERYIQENTPDLQAEKHLAEAYWTRYKDVKDDSYFGVNGPSGIFGARAHFDQHGKREGRIFAPLHIPDDLVLEQQLADLYWRRYPKIEQSATWGRESQLGILGPRDHYLHHGRLNGLRWGTLEKKGEKPEPQTDRRNR